MMFYFFVSKKKINIYSINVVVLILGAVSIVQTWRTWTSSNCVFSGSFFDTKVGGEKTLSSLALVFALHHYKPTPLYVMDEIDAALDFRNVSIVANYIKDRTKNAQFIIISLRNNMFELADRLVGIYRTHNCTKSITIDPKAFSNQGSHSSFASPLNDSTNSTGTINDRKSTNFVQSNSTTN